MIPQALARMAAGLGILLGFPGNLASAWEPIRAHPQNPYIFEFRGQPMLPRTFGAGYDWLFDSSSQFIPYLDVLQRDGMNLARVFCFAFPVSNPADLLQPWPRTTDNGYALDGLGKWDLTDWNEAYFDRIKAFAQAASDRGIVVEFTLFSTFYEDAEWRAGPFHPSNNVQGYGPNNRYACLRPTDVNLYAAQKAAVRRIVHELNGFDNVYFEVQNEPFWNQPGVQDSMEVTFQNAMLAEIRAEESGLPNRHLVAHNFPQYLATMSSDFDIINEHYPIPVPGATVAGGEALLRDQYFRGKLLALDETDTETELQTRLEVWMFFIGGGCVYDGKDAGEHVYSMENSSGDTALGNAIRGAVRNAGTYMDRLHLIALRRNLAWVTGGIPSGATLQASDSPGQQYVAYLHHGKKTAGQNFQLHYDPIDTSNHNVSLRVALPAGTWRAVWTRPFDMVDLHTQEFTHAGGNITLSQVTYQADVALRIERTGAADATPPPRPTGLAAVANADGTIPLSWNAVQAYDLAGYYVYRAETSGVPIDADHRIAVVTAATGFTDHPPVPGTTYHYVVTAVDLTGNESTASSETSVQSATPLQIWRAQYFSAADLADPAKEATVWGNSANPDGDPLSNLQEYAFGTNPNNNASGPGGITYADGIITQRGQPVISITNTDTSVDFRAVFGRRKDWVAAGLSYTVQFSADMSAWEDSVTTPTVVASDADMDAVTVPYPFFLNSGEKAQFFRVQVTIQ
jgi:hypothetical protein